MQSSASSTNLNEALTPETSTAQEPSNIERRTSSKTTKQNVAPTNWNETVVQQSGAKHKLHTVKRYTGWNINRDCGAPKWSEVDQQNEAKYNIHNSERNAESTNRCEMVVPQHWEKHRYHTITRNVGPKKLEASSGTTKSSETQATREFARRRFYKVKPDCDPRTLSETHTSYNSAKLWFHNMKRHGAPSQTSEHKALHNEENSWFRNTKRNAGSTKLIKTLLAQNYTKNKFNAQTWNPSSNKCMKPSLHKIKSKGFSRTCGKHCSTNSRENLAPRDWAKRWLHEIDWNTKSKKLKTTSLSKNVAKRPCHSRSRPACHWTADWGPCSGVTSKRCTRMNRTMEFISNDATSTHGCDSRRASELRRATLMDDRA